MCVFNVFLLQKIIKFGVVGLVGMSIDFSITWCCKERIRINKYLANTAGFSVAVINNFFLNYIWTFNHPSGMITVALGLFIIIAVIGLLINNLLLYIFTDLFKIQFYFSKSFVVIGVFFWNFTLNYIFNFHS